MTAFRRLDSNFSLQRALEWASELNQPLVVLEALRCDYPWASERFHRFVMEGMANNAKRAAATRVLYYSYIEPRPGDGRGLLEAMSESASVVVSDDYPTFFIPRMVDAAAGKLGVKLEKVDSNGLVPLRQAGQVFKTAHSFRRFLQKALPGQFDRSPAPDPLKDLQLPRLDALPGQITSRWPDATAALSGESARLIGDLPVDHTVRAADSRGGSEAAGSGLARFLDTRLSAYGDRNHPDRPVTSDLSPYLHFGHISSHRIFAAIVDREGWDNDCVALQANGARSGWWGMSSSAEAYLDQLVTWRELGFNACAYLEDYDRFASLPDWARTTLADHASDSRTHLYTLSEFEAARTHDRIWNAAQTQLIQEGRLHNYLRMLWGKKILEWSAAPQDALAIMIELNNKYALDGRDPNSYSGIFWCLGRYDRPWGPERPIFGKVRYMSSENTARKLRLNEYLKRYEGEADLPPSAETRS
jgi:deoxyribodipyrimidine photo-lyase